MPRLSLLTLACVLAAGCLPSRATMYQTPASVDPSFAGTLPANVDYRILGPVTGKACGDMQELMFAAGGQKTFSGPVHPQILEAARYDALQQNPAADSLMFPRVMVENDGFKQCVTLTAKAFRVERMMAGGGVGSGPSAPDVAPAKPAPPPAVPAAGPAAPATTPAGQGQ